MSRERGVCASVITCHSCAQAYLISDEFHGLLSFKIQNIRANNSIKQRGSIKCVFSTFL